MEVDHCKNEIESQRQKLSKAMIQTVNLESLSGKIFGQFLTFIQKKVRWVNEQPSYIPKSKIPKDQAAKNEESNLVTVSKSITDLQAELVRYSNTPNANSSLFGNLTKTNVFRQTLTG